MCSCGNIWQPYTIIAMGVTVSMECNPGYSSLFESNSPLFWRGDIGNNSEYIYQVVDV